MDSDDVSFSSYFPSAYQGQNQNTEEDYNKLYNLGSKNGNKK